MKGLKYYDILAALLDNSHITHAADESLRAAGRTGAGDEKKAAEE